MSADETDTRHRALLERGQAALNAGRFGEVRRLCGQIFALAPGSVNGFWLWVMSGPVLPGDKVFARIRAAVQTPLPDPIASQLHFMLGKGYDDMGCHAEAFEAFVAANRLKPARYDPAATRALADAMIAALDAVDLAPLPPAPPRLVFVIGMPRSGTSLMAQMLGAHRQVTSLGEQRALGAACARFARGTNPQLAFLTALDRAALERARAAYLDGIDAAAHPGQVLVDKMPENTWFAGVIPLLFPDALIVHMQRPRLATCWSCFRNDFREGHAYSYDFGHLLAQYDTHLALCEAGRARAGERWHAVSLARLAAHPRETLAPLLTALGLGWDEACLSPEEGGPVATLSKWQLRQGVDPDLPQGWRAYLPYIRDRWGVEE